MTVLVVYGAPSGPARAPALRLARALRALGVTAQVRPAGRVARLGLPSAVVVAVDRVGRDEICELIDSFELSGGTTPLLGLRTDGSPLPPGVRTLPGTRGGGEAPTDVGAALRLASALNASLRRGQPAARRWEA